MRLTKRARRRLLFVIAVVVVGTAAVVLFGAVKSAQRERMRTEERALGLAAFERGDMQATLDHLKVAVQYDKNDLDVILAFAEARRQVPMPNRAHLHEARGYYEHALELVTKEGQADSARARDILMELLHVRGQLGELVEMERVADRLLADDPDNIEALTAKVTATFVDRRFDEAMPLAERLMALEPGEIRWPHLQLQIMRSTQASDDAIIARCDEWLAQPQTDGRMHLLKAAWLFELGREESAQTEIETAVLKGAGSLSVLEQMLSLLGMVNRHDLIATVIEKTREKYADEPWARHAVIQYAWRTGDMDTAMAELQRAGSELDDWPLDLQRDHVLVLMALDRLDEARAALARYRESVEALPRQARKAKSFKNLGDDDTSDRDRALVAALEAKLSPTPLPWPEMLRRYDEAISIATDEPVVHYLRGDLLARAGEHALAATSFATAEALDPTWTAASVAHADALQALGRIEEAFEVSRAAARRAPRHNLSPLLAMARAAIQLNRLPRNPYEVTPVFESEARFAVESARRAAAGMDLPMMLSVIQQELPTNAQVFSLLIEALVQAGRSSDAEAKMQSWLEQTPLTVDQMVAAVDLVRRHDLKARETLKRRLQDYRGDDPRVPMAHAWLLADEGRADAGLAIVNRFFAGAPASVSQSDSAQLARVAFELGIDRPEAWEKLRELVGKFPSSVPVQTFALSHPNVWDDQAFAEQIIANLTAALGERSQQVQLARASYLLHYFADTQEDLARAVVIVQRILEETPTSLVALTLLADAYLQGEAPMYEQAIEALRIAVDAHQREISLYPKLISLLQQVGRYDEAQRYLAQLARLNPSDPRIARAEVELLFSQGDFERALMRAASFIDEHSAPSDVLLLAVMHDRTGDTDKAEELFEQLLASPDADDTVRTQAGEFYARHGRFDEGIALVEQALTHVEEGEQNVLLGWFCYRHGKFDRALAYFDSAVKLSPTSADAWHALARYHLSRKEFDIAQQVASDGLDATGGDDRLRADLGLAVAGASGQPWREALSRLGLQTNDVPSLLATLELAADVGASQPAGESNGTLKISNQQLDAVRALVEAHPRFIPAWYLAVALHANAKQMTPAGEYARTAMSRFPNRPEPAEWATRLFMQEERWNEALSAAEEWVARTSSDPVPAKCAVAFAMIKLGRPSSAVVRLRPHAAALVELRDEHPEQAMMLVDALLGAGQFDELLRVAEPMLHEMAWRQRWAFSARSAPPAVAAAALNEIEKYVTGEVEAEEPGTTLERITLAAEWQQLADRADDTAALERARSLATSAQSEATEDGLVAMAEFVLATIDESAGDVSSAQSRYRRVLELQPDNALALNNLAHLLSASGTAVDEALSLAKKAAGIMPNSPDILDTLGTALLAAGKPAEAENHLRKALSARPSDVNINLNLVDAILHQKRYDDASREMESLQRLLRRQPDGGVEYRQRVLDMQERIREHLTMAQPS